MESVPILQGGARAAIVCATLWGAVMAVFPFAPGYVLSAALLVVAGMLNIAFTSMAQALVQVLAAPRLRGRVVGLFNTAMLGLRSGSGITVGALGALIGVEWSLALSALTVFLISAALLARDARATASARVSPSSSGELGSSADR
jgi:hypothetical protein